MSAARSGKGGARVADTDALAEYKQILRAVLDQRPSAAETDLEPSAGELIQHADFLEQPNRMIER